MTAIFNATGSVPLAQPRPAPETAPQPGGWVSFRGVRTPPPRAARPWWARLLRAHRLVAER
ncbi:hypothetical protein [Verrucosispora sioxanthis]|uniref:hypothetical protein n=1 Tax=Verrucosispora sioxanthis TaxID=2499994 RepID=UPI001C0F5393|nr:hypothetical protein [Verrucosispora sioxanthis]